MDATHGKGCTAYLVAASEGVRDAPLVLAMNGTGEYSMRGEWEEDASAKAALAAGAAWLVFDKPGVTPDTTPAGFHIDDRVYNVYTVEDLTACAMRALAWAYAQPQVGAASPIVIRGHSEGAIVSGATLLGLFDSGSPLATRVSALLLSGTPGGKMRDVVMGQAKAADMEQAYERALAANDHAFFRGRGGIGAGTMQAMFQSRSLGESLDALARHQPSTRITLFHGYEDAAVPVAMSKALVAANRERVLHGEAALDIDARYYHAGHALNQAALHDINLWLLDAIRPHGYLATAERAPPAIAAVAVDEATRAAVVGVYRIDADTDIQITREGTRFFAQATGQSAFPIYFTAENRMATRVAEIELEIERQGDQVVAIHLIQGETIRCPRVG